MWSEVRASSRREQMRGLLLILPLALVLVFLLASVARADDVPDPELAPPPMPISGVPNQWQCVDTYPSTSPPTSTTPTSAPTDLILPSADPLANGEMCAVTGWATPPAPSLPTDTPTGSGASVAASPGSSLPGCPSRSPASAASSESSASPSATDGSVPSSSSPGVLGIDCPVLVAPSDSASLPLWLFLGSLLFLALLASLIRYGRPLRAFVAGGTHRE
jgi:hypothetical protein